MKFKRYLALLLAVTVVCSSMAIPVFTVAQETASLLSATDPNGYGTATVNADGSTTLNFGQNSITLKGGGSIITDSVNGDVLRPDSLKTAADADLAILTLPAINLKNSGYDKVELYAANLNTSTVTVKAGDSEIAKFENVVTGVDKTAWQTYKIFTTPLTNTDAEGNITLNISIGKTNTYCGNYVYVRFYGDNMPTPAPTETPIATATPIPTATPVPEGTPIYLDTNYSFEERAADLVSRMTLEEKSTQFTDGAASIPRLQVAGYNYWSEALHGVARQGQATSFPSPLSMSNTWNRALINQMAAITSSEARAKLTAKNAGKTNEWEKSWNLSYWSPTINMARDPRWGRNEETMGEDPYLTAQLANEFVDGMQGNDPKYLKTISTLKHFAANNVEAERASGSSVMDETTFREYYGRAFQDIMEKEHAASVMSAYNATTIYRNGDFLTARNGQKINYIASSANSYLLNDMLRRTWGFDGYITGDCAAFAQMNTKAPLKKGLFRDRDISKVPVEEVIPQTFLNGADIDCSLSGGGGADPAVVLKMVSGGYITEDQLDVALYRLFLTRMRTGEFDKGAIYQDTPANIIESDSSVAVSESLSEESWVLLKNDNNALPLDTNDKNIIIVGPRAGEVILGDYSGEPTKKVTPAAGIKAEVERTYPGSTVNYISSVTDTTPLMNIKSINLVDKSGKKTAVDLSKLTISGATYDNGIITNITKNAKITAASVDFSTVDSIVMEVATGTQPGGSISIHYGSGGSIESVIRSVATADSNTYAECSAKYTGADGGYNGTAAMELTFEANTTFSVEQYKAALDAADVIIAYASTMFGKDYDASESNDRESIDMPATQAHVTALTDAYPTKTVVVMQAVGQINVEPFMDKCAAMLWTSYNGQTQGTAIGKVLAGGVNPSGKLTTTWYKKADLNNMPFTATSVTEDGVSGWMKNDYGIKSKDTFPGRTYQYHTGTPVYPFGYGLSYTSFEYSNPKIDQSTVDAGGTVNLSVDVKNIGTVAGKETVQLYVSVPGADGITLPKQQLKGFDKVELQPGETKTVTIPLSIESLRLFSETNQKVYVNAGEYIAKLAKNSSDAGVSVKFNVTGALKSELKTVTAIPNGVSVHGLIREDGTNHQTITTINSDISAVMTDEVMFDLSKADKVEYTSSNTEVATVDANGIVSSGVKEGVTTITATVTIAGVTKSTSYPVINELQIRPSQGDVDSAKASLKSTYDKLPKSAYSEANWDKIDQIYNTAIAACDTIATKTELNVMVAKTINALSSVAMDNLTNSYSIISENPLYIEKGVIDYREGGIPMYSGATGTITNASPYTGIQLKAFDKDGNQIDNSKIVWQVQKFDDSIRKVAEIDSATGILTVYGNGIIQITAANIEAMTCGTLMVQVNTQVEAEYADDSGSADLTDSQSSPSGGYDAGSTADAWIEYKSIKLSNLDSMKVRYAGKNSGTFNISLDKSTAGNIGTLSLPATGGWGAWADADINLNRAALNAALLGGKLDQYGCATVYIQTNGTNLDYFRMEYIENNDVEPYNFEKVLNMADGKVKVTLSYLGSTLSVDVPMIAVTYNTDGSIKKLAVTKVNGTGEYTINLGASDGDTVDLFVWSGLDGLKPLSAKKQVVYKTPIDSSFVIYTLDDPKYSTVFSPGTDTDGVALPSANGLSGYGALILANNAVTYKYYDVNEKETTYSFKKAWQGGMGGTTKRCLYFTPTAPCKVTVVFDGKGNTGRVQNIEQNGKVIASAPSLSGVTAFSAEITDTTNPVYVYGGGQDKRVYAIIVEYYGKAETTGSVSELDSNSQPVFADGEDRPVQFATWGSANVVLTKNDVTNETKVWIVGAGNIRMPLSTSTFYEAPADYKYGDILNINKLAEYKDRLYAGCDNGLVIVFTNCIKCYQLKKVSDFDIKEMSIKDGIMYISDGITDAELNMITDLGAESIEPDEAKTLAANGAVLVDVRTAEEFAAKSYEGSVNIPIDTLESGLANYSKDTVLIFYCASGGRAAKAVQKATELGFTSVYNLGSIDKLL